MVVMIVHDRGRISTLWTLFRVFYLTLKKRNWHKAGHEQPNVSRLTRLALENNVVWNSFSFQLDSTFSYICSSSVMCDTSATFRWQFAPAVTCTALGRRWWSEWLEVSASWEPSGRCSGSALMTRWTPRQVRTRLSGTCPPFLWSDMKMSRYCREQNWWRVLAAVGGEGCFCWQIDLTGRFDVRQPNRFTELTPDASANAGLYTHTHTHTHTRTQALFTIWAPFRSVSVHAGPGLWGVIAAALFDEGKGILYKWDKRSGVVSSTFLCPIAMGGMHPKSEHCYFSQAHNERTYVFDEQFLSFLRHSTCLDLGLELGWSECHHSVDDCLVLPHFWSSKKAEVPESGPRNRRKRYTHGF